MAAFRWRRRSGFISSCALSSLGYCPMRNKFVIPGAAAMGGLFLSGNLFGYLILGHMLQVLFAMFGSQLDYLPSAEQYIS